MTSAEETIDPLSNDSLEKIDGASLSDPGLETSRSSGTRQLTARHSDSTAPETEGQPPQNGTGLASTTLKALDHSSVETGANGNIASSTPSDDSVSLASAKTKLTSNRDPPASFSSTNGSKITMDQKTVPVSNDATATSNTAEKQLAPSGSTATMPAVPPKSTESVTGSSTIPLRTRTASSDSIYSKDSSQSNNHSTSKPTSPSASNLEIQQPEIVNVPELGGNMIIKKKKGRFKLLQEVPSSAEASPVIHHKQQQLHTPAVPIPSQTVNGGTAPSPPQAPAGAVPVQKQPQHNRSTPSPPQLDRKTTNPPPPPPTAATPVLPHSQLVRERTSSIASIQGGMSVTGQQPTTFDGTGAPVVKKKGRFVVTNVKDPGFVAVPLQAIVSNDTNIQMVLTTANPSTANGNISATVVPTTIVQAATANPSLVHTSQPPLQHPPPLAPTTTATPANTPATVSDKKRPEGAPRQRQAPGSRNNGGGLAAQSGLGKVFYFLDQMKMEVTEADKTIKSLQADLRFVKEKNKELEMKAREAERKYQEEKLVREGAERKCKALRKKLRLLGEKEEKLAGEALCGSAPETEFLESGAVNDKQSNENTVASSGSTTVEKKKDDTDSPPIQEVPLPTRVTTESRAASTSPKPPLKKTVKRVASGNEISTPPRDVALARASEALENMDLSSQPKSAPSGLERNSSAVAAQSTHPLKQTQNVAQAFQSQALSAHTSANPRGQNSSSSASNPLQQSTENLHTNISTPVKEKHHHKSTHSDFDPLRPESPGVQGSSGTQNDQWVNSAHVLMVEHGSVSVPVVNLQGQTKGHGEESPMHPSVQPHHGHVRQDSHSLQELQQPMLLVPQNQIAGLSDWSQSQGNQQMMTIQFQNSAPNNQSFQIQGSNNGQQHPHFQQVPQIQNAQVHNSNVLQHQSQVQSNPAQHHAQHQQHMQQNWNQNQQWNGTQNHQNSMQSNTIATQGQSWPNQAWPANQLSNANAQNSNQWTAQNPAHNFQQQQQWNSGQPYGNNQQSTVQPQLQHQPNQQQNGVPHHNGNNSQQSGQFSDFGNHSLS